MGLLPARSRALPCLSVERRRSGGHFRPASAICFAWRSGTVATPILKERLFGLTGGEGNHGEDVKEYYFYLDSTPTHSYMRFLYKYPHAAFPYGSWSKRTGAAERTIPNSSCSTPASSKKTAYFDVEVEYAEGATRKTS